MVYIKRLYMRRYVALACHLCLYVVVSTQRIENINRKIEVEILNRIK